MAATDHVVKQIDLQQFHGKQNGGRRLSPCTTLESIIHL